MVTPYLLLKLLHVVLAIFAVGSNLTYGFWLSRAASDPLQQRFALEGIKALDRAANVAYVLLLLTGLALAFLGAIPFQTFWVAAALVLYAIVAVLGVAVFSPLSKRRRELLAERGPDDPEYKAATVRSTRLGVATLVAILGIVFLMVVKPTP